jgi:cytochrome c553
MMNHAIVLCSALSIFAQMAHSQSADAGAVVFNSACVQCHGAKGEGNLLMKAPAIGGMSAWAVERQLQAFRHGYRGTDTTEPVALVMAATAKALPEAQLAAVAAHVEKLPLHTHLASDWNQKADLKAGRILFEERCMECHRYNASGEIYFGSPPLLGLQDWYLLSQLEKFVNGKRGTAAADVFGQKMVAVTRVIPNEQAMRDVIAYISTLKPTAPAPAPAPQPGNNPFDEVKSGKN